MSSMGMGVGIGSHSRFFTKSNAWKIKKKPLHKIWTQTKVKVPEKNVLLWTALVNI